MTELFRKVPSKELVEEILIHLQFLGFNDNRIFTKFDIPKEPLQTYQFHLLPGALTDYIDQKNDTLSYKVTTRNTTDYGNLRVNLTNVKQFPVIVQLTNEKGDVIASEFLDKVKQCDKISYFRADY